jgi:hypothetical protein
MAQTIPIPTVDVTEPGWETVLDTSTGESTFFCLPQAAPYARKKLSPRLLFQVRSPENLLEDKADRSKIVTEPVAARTGEILLSDKWHPGTTSAKVWLSTYHLELMKELLGLGYTIELLDSNNNVVRRLENNGPEHK